MVGEHPFPIVAPGEAYVGRRARLAERLSRPVAVFAGHAPARNYAGNPHRFRAGSTYLYLGGPPIEHAVLLIEPGSDGVKGCTLARPPIGPDDELWEGAKPGDAQLASAAGLPEAELCDPDAFAQAWTGKPVAFIAPPFAETLATIQRLGFEPANEDELLTIIDMRNRKDEHELAAMRRSARVAMEGHRAAMAATRAGVREADVAAAFWAVMHRNQCDVSFSPIVTVRGETLHLHGHPNRLEDGQLLLIDAGAEEPGGYASDFTRTFPVSGTWSPIQRHLYDTVERALNLAVAACVPGRRYREVHDLSARVICEGLVEAELLRGNADDLVERRAHTLFFPHGVGHLIGLDAHDMEDFGDLAGYAAGRTRRTAFGDKFLRLDRDLAPGFAVTVEPGIYFVPAIWRRDDLVGPLADAVNRAKVDELLDARFGGIRIEHTICVREADAGGPEILSAELPTDADAVAACVGRE